MKLVRGKINQRMKRVLMLKKLSKTVDLWGINSIHNIVRDKTYNWWSEGSVSNVIEKISIYEKEIEQL